jgi:hypothetical protein
MWIFIRAVPAHLVHRASCPFGPSCHEQPNDLCDHPRHRFCHARPCAAAAQTHSCLGPTAATRVPLLPVGFLLCTDDHEIYGRVLPHHPTPPTHVGLCQSRLTKLVAHAPPHRLLPTTTPPPCRTLPSPHIAAPRRTVLQSPHWLWGLERSGRWRTMADTGQCGLG